MKKKHNLGKLLLTLSLALALTGCTSLDYVDDDVQTVQTSRVQTSENFNFQVFEKSIDNVNIKAGISETNLESALVLYMSVQNNSDTNYKFTMSDIKVTSPIGEVTIIPSSLFIEGYYNFEASNYANLANAGTMLGNFASIQNTRYANYQSVSSKTQNMNSTNPDMVEIEKVVEGIQKHTTSTYQYISPNSREYFYIFLRKPEEYPIVVNYKSLTYKFGGKKNVQN